LVRQPNPDRRNPHTHKAIIKATLSLLKATRYHGLTIEAVAAKAKVGKATVYRWWPSKGALVAEAIASTMKVEDPTETGDLRQDLINATEVSIANFLRPPGGVLIQALASEIADDSKLLRSFTENFINPRREVVAKLIRRGVADGILPSECQPDVIMDMWAGALFYQNLFRHHPISETLATDLVDAVFGAYLPA
jgi:AcrR family transcriptional regulator